MDDTADTAHVIIRPPLVHEPVERKPGNDGQPPWPSFGNTLPISSVAADPAWSDMKQPFATERFPGLYCTALP